MGWPSMKHQRWFGFLLVVLVGACQLNGLTRSHTVMGANAQELRIAFNADTGMVRVVLLVAPT